MRRVLPVTALVWLVPRVAAACPVCFGASDGPMLQGSNMGILALLVVTVGMLGAFAAFFLRLARRSADDAIQGSEGGPHPLPAGDRAR